MKHGRFHASILDLTKRELAAIEAAAASIPRHPKEIIMEHDKIEIPPDLPDLDKVPSGRVTTNPWALIHRCLYALQGATNGNTQAQAVILRDGRIEIVPIYRLGMGCNVLMTATRATLRRGFQITELANMEKAFLQAIVLGADPLGPITRLYNDDGSNRPTEPIIV